MKKDTKNSIIVVLFVGLLLLFILYVSQQRHLNRVEPYIKSSGMFYSWMHYKCIGGVMYFSGKAGTLMVNPDGTPKLCEIVRMTNREYYNL